MISSFFVSSFIVEPNGSRPRVHWLAEIVAAFVSAEYKAITATTARMIFLISSTGEAPEFN